MKQLFFGKITVWFVFIIVLDWQGAWAGKPTSVKHPVYVLVHGAWHGGWCWQQVSAQLRATGATVYTPTLSGMGEHQHTLTPAINLDTHITDIVNLLVMEDLHDVVLVGHSYAGAVITGVADRIPERLRQLVFLDAVLVENGQSLLDVHPKDIQAAFAAAAAPSRGLSLPIRPSASFGVNDVALSRWADARLTPQPYRCFSQPIVLRNPYGNGLPTSYIACTQPALSVLKVFAERTKHNPNWSYYELATGHDAMLSQPAETAALLQRISQR
ncbi:alpha/beta fold hydrolase [Spirosoma sp. 209]|uniref:alpha/beta fold hydrolase n=1 Tax=Spirosoma sp. 209 TaxID=1955701 RepID=UPI00098D4CB7|nr:alpha/beta hydrolase [Spirosoma sp. 209]